MSQYGRRGIRQVITGVVLLGFSGFLSSPFGWTMGRHGSSSLWRLVLLGIGIMFLAKGASSIFTVYTGRKRKKDSLKQKKLDEEKTILRMARENSGIVTVAKTSLALGKSLDTTEQLLNTLVSKGHATMEMNGEGRIYYLFADFLDR